LDEAEQERALLFFVFGGLRRGGLLQTAPAKALFFLVGWV